MWRIITLPLLLMLSTANSPDPTKLGNALASVNDWRAISIVLVVVIGMLMGFIAWREFGLNRLAKALDGVTNVLWALRLALAERGIKADDGEPK